MRRPVVVTALAVALLTPAALVAAPAQAATRPGKITAVSSAPGPHPGEVTVRWKQTGGHTTSFRIETGLTTFRKGSAVLPDHGRRTRYFTVAASRRSVTLTAKQVASAGAAPGTGNHLFFRLTAVNTKGPGTATRAFPYLQSVAPKPVTPEAGTPLRVASFNVRTARGANPPWLGRVDAVAATILSRSPGVAILQELSPGRSDGGSGNPTGGPRQSQTLVDALAARGAGRYQLVRKYWYIGPAEPTGTQGARILYDTTRYELLSDCPDRSRYQTTVSTSCSMEMPVLPEDDLGKRRSAAWALLQDRSTGKRFMVVSVHLDERKSADAATQERYQALRTKQVRAVLARVAVENPDDAPVVLGGDLNSWQAARGGDPAHDALVTAGFYDSADAVTQVNTRWTTYNAFARTVPKSPSGWGARLDVIATKGLRGAVRFENVLTRTQSNRPSDHDMVVADLLLP
ncbi:endonuclease/exonuclease/phosphatase family protein [Angustibacter aerolatus]